MRHICSAATTAAAALVLAASSHSLAQTAPAQYHMDRVNLDSGVVANNAGPGHQVVYSTTITRPGAPWLRLYFGDVALSGNMFNPDASYVRITSMLDGAVQTLNARELRDWHNSTAYFNGDTVVVELLASNTGLNRLEIDTVDVGEQVVANPESICGVDDRQLSTDPRNARLMPIGCTVWLIDDAAHCFITAGHCIQNGNTNGVAQFNVPLSSSGGGTMNPPPQDQYPVDTPSVQSNGGQGVGNDYAYVGFNESAGMTAFERQGMVSYSLSTDFPANSTPINITGYGTVSSPVSPTWNQVQKIHIGPKVTSNTGGPNPISYQTDTSGGNSGSPVVNESTGNAIGVHTHAGCSATNGNNGTHLAHTGFQNILNNPTGNCVPLGLIFTHPAGLPALVDPAGGTIINVEVAASGGNTPQPGTGMFHYDIGAGFVSVPMNQTSSNVYEAVTPAVMCGTVMDYFFSAESTAGTMYLDPFNAPASTFSTLSGVGFSTVAEIDFENSTGWTVENVSLLTGAWTIETPAVGGVRSDPPSDFDGSGQCAITGNTTNEDVDGGPTRLISPVFDISSLADATVSAAIWHATNGGDPFTIEFSDNAGSSWTLVDTLGDQGEQWNVMEWSVGNHVSITSQFQVRFGSADNPNNSVTESGVDAFKIRELLCGTMCYADCDGSGTLNILDYICFGDDFAAGGTYADCDGSGSLNILDYICFGDEFAAGCP